MMGPLSDADATGADAPGPGVATRTCPNPACGQPIAAEQSFCAACGTAVEQERERPRPWLILVGLLWLLIAVGAYFFIYSSAFTSFR